MTFSTSAIVLRKMFAMTPFENIIWYNVDDLHCKGKILCKLFAYKEYDINVLRNIAKRERDVGTCR